MKKLILFFICCFYGGKILSQNIKSNNFAYEGNKKMEEKIYDKSEIDYRKAISENANNLTAIYNLGNNHYVEKNLDEAQQQYYEAQKKAKNSIEKHKAFHNIGNVFMDKKEYEKAVDAYKNALRNNPEDNETRYNYVLAKALLKKQQQQNKNQDKNQDKNKDKKSEKNKESDNTDKNKKDEEKEKKSDKKDPDTKENQKPKKQPNNGLSPQQIKNLLEAMNNQEKKVQEKLNAQKVKVIPINQDKDW